MERGKAASWGRESWNHLNRTTCQFAAKAERRREQEESKKRARREERSCFFIVTHPVSSETANFVEREGSCLLCLPWMSWYSWTPNKLPSHLESNPPSAAWFSLESQIPLLASSSRQPLGWTAWGQDAVDNCTRRRTYPTSCHILPRAVCISTGIHAATQAGPAPVFSPSGKPRGKPMPLAAARRKLNPPKGQPTGEWWATRFPYDNTTETNITRKRSNNFNNTNNNNTIHINTMQLRLNNITIRH